MFVLLFHSAIFLVGLFFGIHLGVRHSEQQYTRDHERARRAGYNRGLIDGYDAARPQPLQRPHNLSPASHVSSRHLRLLDPPEASGAP